jgi:hypothetical protein
MKRMILRRNGHLTSRAIPGFSNRFMPVSGELRRKMLTRIASEKLPLKAQAEILALSRSIERARKTDPVFHANHGIATALLCGLPDDGFAACLQKCIRVLNLR